MPSDVDDEYECEICGEDTYGSSHYHCEGCGELTGMFGHWDARSNRFACEPAA